MGAFWDRAAYKGLAGGLPVETAHPGTNSHSPPAMTLANKITIARILLIPIFIVQVLYFRQTGDPGYRWVALAVFLVASLSDALDGWIARRFNQRSQLGAVLDPLADKLLIVAALILLSRTGSPHLPALPIWLVATVLSRDALLVLGLGVIHFTCGRFVVKPNLTGKAATVLQMAIILLTLADLWPGMRYWVALVTAVVTAISGLIYVRNGLQQLSASPHSAPDSPRP